MRHEDLIENTTTWLLDFQEQFKLRTRPGFPIEVCVALPPSQIPRPPWASQLRSRWRLALSEAHAGMTTSLSATADAASPDDVSALRTATHACARGCLDEFGIAASRARCRLEPR